MVYLELTLSKPLLTYITLTYELRRGVQVILQFVFLGGFPTLRVFEVSGYWVFGVYPSYLPSNPTPITSLCLPYRAFVEPRFVIHLMASTLHLLTEQ